MGIAIGHVASLRWRKAEQPLPAHRSTSDVVGGNLCPKKYTVSRGNVTGKVAIAW
jgi:hypothetical protein